MKTQYTASSPYYTTVKHGQFLDVLNYRPISKKASDQLFTISHVYNLRPDLLAYDLYKNAGLWWVFAARNPNSLKDPLFDFVTGNSIYLPQLSTLNADLGI
jgi:hypothetical protein